MFPIDISYPVSCTFFSCTLYMSYLVCFLLFSGINFFDNQFNVFPKRHKIKAIDILCSTFEICQADTVNPDRPKHYILSRI